MVPHFLFSQFGAVENWASRRSCTEEVFPDLFMDAAAYIGITRPDTLDLSGDGERVMLVLAGVIIANEGANDSTVREFFLEDFDVLGLIQDAGREGVVFHTLY